MSMDIADNNKIFTGYSTGKSVPGSGASTDNMATGSRTKETDRNDENNKENTGAKQAVAHSSIKDAVNRANNVLSKTHCEFAYNDAVNRVSITVIDDDTGDVIREIPPEESLKMLEKMWEITGLMVDEKR